MKPELNWRGSINCLPFKDYGFLNHKLAPMCCTFPNIVCALMVWLLIKSYAFITQCHFLSQSNKQVAVASSFTRPEPIWFYLSDMLQDKTYSSNSCTERYPKERIQNIVFQTSMEELWHIMDMSAIYEVHQQLKKIIFSIIFKYGE